MLDYELLKGVQGRRVIQFTPPLCDGRGRGIIFLDYCVIVYGVLS